MYEAFSESVEPAVKEVFETMAGHTPQMSEKETIEKPVSMGDLSAVVGFSSDTHKGVVVVHYTRAMALFMADKIFQLGLDEVNGDLNEDVLDACGEVANMISGNIKKYAVEKGIPEYNVAVPTVVIGRNLKSSINIKGASTIYPFQFEDNKLVIELKVQENQKKV